MGMFDSVWVDCPRCGGKMEFQSKEGECYLNNYSLDDAPIEVLRDIVNDPSYHEKCGQWVVIVSPDIPPGPPPRPTVKIERVKPPKNPTTHPQGFKWWPADHAFTYDDIDPTPPPAGRQPCAS